ncbi:MAG: hypothetical protein CUN56_08360 [Phototrophicales bacterium]|nr:MAG: hypothetical protein CUN56_08360 [Phototrophicales bacterium]RMG70546.1 MAG: hypothetical protein D6711_17070 [Chloroflexota bacterium]
MNRKKITLITILLLMGMIFMPSQVLAQGNVRPQAGYWTIYLSDETFASCVGTQTYALNTADLYGQMTFTILLERANPGLQVNRAATLNHTGANDYIGTLVAEGSDTVQMLISVEGSRNLSGRLIITYLDGDRWCSTTTPFSGEAQT